MMSKITQALIVAVIMLAVIAFGLFSHTESLSNKAAQLERDKTELSEKVEVKQATINTMAYQQLTAAKIDAQYVTEMNNAKSELEAMERGVANGTIGLHINATCPGVSNTSGASGVGNAESPRLGNTAERDYFTLRDRIKTATSQISYLQDYIINTCQKPNPSTTNSTNNK
jgi:prophage endopeptidase